MGAAIHRQLWSDAVRRSDRGRCNRSDVQQRHRARDLLPCALSCGPGCRQFETGGHEDAQATSCRLFSGPVGRNRGHVDAHEVVSTLTGDLAAAAKPPAGSWLSLWLIHPSGVIHQRPLIPTYPGRSRMVADAGEHRCALLEGVL